MKENETVFYLYYDWIDDLDENLSGAEAWEVVKALCAYHRSGANPVELVEGAPRIAVALMFHQIKRREEKQEKRAEAAKSKGEQR